MTKHDKTIEYDAPLMNYVIEHAFVASTAHITEADAKLLEELSQDPHTLEIVYEKNEYGFWIYTWLDPVTKLRNPAWDKSKLSSAAKRLIDIARGHHCEWVMLDRDGPVYFNLEVFQW